MDDAIPQNIRASIGRLIQVAKGDTGQSRRSCEFPAGLVECQECGAFNLTDFWGLDALIAADMTFVRCSAGCQHYPDTLGYCAEVGLASGQAAANSLN